MSDTLIVLHAWVRSSVPSTGLTLPSKVSIASGVTCPGAVVRPGFAWGYGAFWANAAVAPSTDIAAATKTTHRHDLIFIVTLLALSTGRHHGASSNAGTM